MSLAVLVPYRPRTAHRERIYECTSRMWAGVDVEVVHASDGLEGRFSFARAANEARAKTDATSLLVYCVDALPLPASRLAALDAELCGGTPWVTLFDGQQRFTPEQTERILAGGPVEPAAGEICYGREALIGVRADVWDELRGMDARFVGWGYEDIAFHHVLSRLYPGGNDVPTDGFFQSLWHPPAVTTKAYRANERLWNRYEQQRSTTALRNFYLTRE